MIRSGCATDFVLSPNVGSRREGVKVDILLMHYTGMATAEAARDWLCNPLSKVSCHYLVDVDGAITQMVDEELRAWHAGLAHWKGVEDINSSSIGIEIQNRGHMLGYDAFPARQMAAVVELCGDIVQRHAIPASHVLAHSDVAPSRKIDPGEKFDWRLLHAHGIGHWVEPEAADGDAGKGLGDCGDDVLALQQSLRLYGYGLACDGSFGRETKAVVEAFQRHFRPGRINGVADGSTLATLAKLVAAL
jgi:N-acetylmuramoyl-L-alanine amidase